MMVHEYINVKTTYTNLYTIFCRIYGIVWHCIMSFCDMIGANVLKFRDFGFSWNHSVSKVLVPLSPPPQPQVLASDPCKDFFFAGRRPTR